MNQSQDHKASLPSQLSNVSANETVVSIIHHSKEKNQENNELVTVVKHTSSLEGYEVIGSYEPPDPPIEKQCLEQLFTPWGMRSLLILLFANMLLSWAQWSTEKQLANTTINQAKSQEISLSKPVNLTTKNLKNLTLDKLSLLPVSPTSAIRTANSSIKTPRAITQTPAYTAVAHKGASNLTNALLPPSLQPQLVQTYSTTSAPSPSLTQSLPVRPVSRQQVPHPSQSQPVYPSIKPAPVQSPQVTQNAEKKAQLEQRIFEEIRIREQKPEPLGFNHQTRAKLRAAQNQQAPSQLIEQLQQLQNDGSRKSP